MYGGDLCGSVVILLDFNRKTDFHILFVVFVALYAAGSEIFLCAAVLRDVLLRSLVFISVFAARSFLPLEFLLRFRTL
jgi:hypothetical protein